VDTDGVVKLADFGVAATSEGSPWAVDGRAHRTYIGTPCWMAPEVMEQTMG
jgi:serine/threonine-protein kinase OSR1/STK39